MNRTAKYLADTASAALAAGALVMLGTHDRSARPAVPPHLAPVRGQAPPVAANPAAVPDSPDTDIVMPPLPASAVYVPDEDLLKLSALVDLPNAPDRSIDKSRWTRAIPLAQQLAQGPCDCEQRNWLNHFLEMGDAALSGSEYQYYKLAGLMLKMARNDQQLADDPGRTMR